MLPTLHPPKEQKHLLPTVQCQQESSLLRNRSSEYQGVLFQLPVRKGLEEGFITTRVTLCLGVTFCMLETAPLVASLRPGQASNTTSSNFSKAQA